MPYVNGFCMAISQETYRNVGRFDEELFTDGYGEEIDYCIRARNAGFSCVLADHLFVYHHKSSSYGAARRLRLSKDAELTLASKYGAERIRFFRKWINNDETLTYLRKGFALHFANAAQGAALADCL